MSFAVLAELGIGLDDVNEDPIGVCIQLRQEMAKTIADAKSTQTATSETLTSTAKTYATDEDLVSAVNTVMAAMRSLMLDAIDEDPRVSVLISHRFDEITDSLKAERDYHMTQLRRQKGEQDSVDLPLAEKRAESIGSLIDMVWRQVQQAGVKLADDARLLLVGETTKFDSEKHGGMFPVFESKSNGLQPRLPKNLSLKDGAISPRGRAYSYSRLRFTWNEQELPADLMPHDVVHRYVSDRETGFTISWGKVIAALKAQGIDPTDGGWSLDFPTGTLSAEIRKADV